MPISVVCPGCLKRFQVSEKFAGMKGPCPKCNTVINIPKEQVVIHGTDDFASGGKNAKGELILKPISRIETQMSKNEIILALVGSIAILLLALILGKVLTNSRLLDAIGFFGMLAISFPLALFGYRQIRDPESIDIFEGADLYKRAGLCGGIYTLLWFLFETLSWYISANANYFFYFLCMAVFIGLSLIAAHAIFDFDFVRGLLHYGIFWISIIVLRGTMGLGWIWMLEATIAGKSDRPPPTPF